MRGLPTCGHGDHTGRPGGRIPSAEALEGAAELFRALGDARRLRLLIRLAAGEACVTQLAEEEGEGLTTISARLKALHAARLVTRRREAKHVFYALADGHVRTLLDNALEHAVEPPPRRAADQDHHHDHEDTTTKGTEQ